MITSKKKAIYGFIACTMFVGTFETIQNTDVIANAGYLVASAYGGGSGAQAAASGAGGFIGGYAGGAVGAFYGGPIGAYLGGLAGSALGAY